MAERLLVVEDSKPIASVIKQIARSLGYQVTIAGSLSEVEQILQGDNDFFAATIDFSLPDATNGEAIECVLSHGIPGVVMTGKMDDATRQKILNQPVIDYITKENSQAFLYLKRILHWQLRNAGNGVLVVDDSASARNHVVELLKRRNFTVYTATNGVQAMAVLGDHPDIKLLITDLEMPEMDGIALTNAVRKQYPREQLAIIGISGVESGVHSARFIKNGADDFLRKPFCPEEFYCRIMQNIESLYHLAEIQKAAFTDHLTNLPNRRAFFRDASSRLADYQNNDLCYGVALLDIDYFKQVNDTYGHDAGDQVLKVIAIYLRKHFGSGLYARMGGEEFVVLLSARDEDALYEKLDECRRNISVSPVPFNDHQLSITVSIGAVFNLHLDLEQQLTDADKALYFAKENGRNQLYVPQCAEG